MKTVLFVRSQISVWLLSSIGHIIRINEVESGEKWCTALTAVLCYAYVYSSEYIFGLCIILCVSMKKY